MIKEYSGNSFEKSGKRRQYKLLSLRIFASYQKDFTRKNNILHKIRTSLEAIRFTQRSFKTLTNDSHFIKLLMVEHMHIMPRAIANLLIKSSSYYKYQEYSALHEYTTQLSCYDKSNPALPRHITALESLDLISHINSNALALLPDKKIPEATYKMLKYMNYTRQIYAVQQMNAVNQYDSIFARVLLITTPPEQLVNCDKSKVIYCLNKVEIRNMETKMQKIDKEFSLIENNYGAIIILITLIACYFRILLSNTRILDFLQKNYRTIYRGIYNITKNW